MRWRTTAAGLVAALVVVLASGRPAHAQALHRFAVVVGNDQGGPDTRPLIYAGVDAAKVYDILTRLGGVQAADAALVVDGGSGDVLAALARVGRQAADAGRRGEHTALFFYYSGHAKDGALRLGDTRLPIDTLRGTVAAAPVDVRIVILDACRSGVVAGAGTRTKGARRAPAFAIESERPRDAKGMVILTSSSSDEDSQESDAIGGSYFSHHLASGLLGGADRSGDGRVTLFEAYAYAYDRTVADTADSLAGPQHPTFSYDLAGNGDLVLTDVASRHEGITSRRRPPAVSTTWWTGRGSWPPRSTRVTAPIAAWRWRPAATASSGGWPTACASARSTSRAASWSRWKRITFTTRRSARIP